jgi:hypothetical protein
MRNMRVRTNGCPCRMHRVFQPALLEYALDLRNFFGDRRGWRAEGYEAEIRYACWWCR